MSRERRQRLAAERALDAVLADSFPASDPPSWTLGVAHVAVGDRRDEGSPVDLSPAMMGIES